MATYDELWYWAQSYGVQPGNNINEMLREAYQTVGTAEDFNSAKKQFFTSLGKSGSVTDMESEYFGSMYSMNLTIGDNVGERGWVNGSFGAIDDPKIKDDTLANVYCPSSTIIYVTPTSGSPIDGETLMRLYFHDNVTLSITLVWNGSQYQGGGSSIYIWFGLNLGQTKRFSFVVY